jgi:ABC-type transport system involved in cytochrome bd biosynthesis fused ATPase/permease subunit
VQVAAALAERVLETLVRTGDVAVADTVMCTRTLLMSYGPVPGAKLIAQDVSVEIPKRRLTVSTGVSGPGKSSLVFDTIAAESQRLINETHSAFVQSFMPTRAGSEVDILEGLTTARTRT